MTTIDEYSTSSLYLTAMANNQSISTATGFTFLHSGSVFLVTNWHVLSGRHPSTGQPLNSNGAIPDSIKVLLHLTGRLDQWKECLFNLYDNNDDATWLQHPRGQVVDVAAIKIDIPIGQTHHAINERKSTEEMKVTVAQDVFVIGFPLGLVAGGALPIWKRASIASEPDINLDDVPKIYLDTATREGMSGSPVIYRPAGPYLSMSGQTRIAVGGTQSKFLGIYSGRLGKDEMQAQLGILWKKETITQVVSSNTPGSYQILK